MKDIKTTITIVELRNTDAKDAYSHSLMNKTDTIN